MILFISAYFCKCTSAYIASTSNTTPPQMYVHFVANHVGKHFAYVIIDLVY